MIRFVFILSAHKTRWPPIRSMAWANRKWSQKRLKKSLLINLRWTRVTCANLSCWLTHNLRAVRMHIASPLTKRQRSFRSKDRLVDKLAPSFWRRSKSVSNIIIQAHGKINSSLTKVPRLVKDIILKGIPMNGKKLRSSSKLLWRSRSRRSRGFRIKCSGLGFSPRPSTKRRS